MRVVRSAVAVAVLTLAGGLLAAPAAHAAPGSVVISQVYGGGGNAGATYTHDFVELFNRSDAAVALTGWSVQYASATGTTFASTALTGTLAPGRYFLVQEGPGAGGTTPLPTPDATGTIAMSASAGKVRLADGAAAVVDLVGYGPTASLFEGAGPTPAPSNTNADLRKDGGCTDTDNNASDFEILPPDPRNTATTPNPCGAPPAEGAPTVTSTAPADNATGVATSADLTVTFSEPVTATASAFTVSCATSGRHAVTVSAGPTTFTLDPAVDFSASEVCTVTVVAAQVSDQDSDDPPDNMAADHVFDFTTAGPPVRIHDIQGATHISPVAGSAVTIAPSIVTAVRSSGYYLQDPSPDADQATSEALFVFTGAAPAVAVGDSVAVSGTVTEFRPGGGSSTGLTITEITTPRTTLVSAGNPLPAPTVIGTGGRIPPTEVIEDDATGNVETSGVFDPAQDGIDFYESLEGMRVKVNNAVASGPTTGFGEISVLADDGANAGVRTTRGGIVVRPNDFNPERIILDDPIVATPDVNVGDHFTAAVVGVMDYSFNNFKLNITAPLTAVHDGVAPETTTAPGAGELAVATINVENLDPGDPADKITRLAIIVNNMQAPDLLSLEEVQDNNGPTNDTVVDATSSYQALIDAISAAGGPAYQFQQINPVDDQDGGEPGGNIRVGFLFRTDRGLSFVDRPGGDGTTPVAVQPGPQLSVSPGRVDPTNPAFSNSRKPLAGEFVYNGSTLFVVANHFNSKGGDQPLYGKNQPPTRGSEIQRHQQAQIVNSFVDEILAEDPNANLVVLGDINDFEFSTTMDILEGDVLTALMKTLPEPERYSYVFDGNSQSLDHIVVSDSLFVAKTGYDVVHVNAEFADQASDHDPTFETPGQSVTFSAAGLDGPTTGTAKVQVSDPDGEVGQDTATVNVVNVAPTITAVAPGFRAICGAGSAFTVTFTDPGAAQTFTATVNWGDGAIEQFTALSSPFSPMHTYAKAGRYTASVAVTDDDGGVSAPAGTALHVDYTAVGGSVQPPLNTAGERSVFRSGTVLAVKVQLRDCDGTFPATLAPTLDVALLSHSTPPIRVNEAYATPRPDVGSTMRFLPAQNSYVYNLPTKRLPDQRASYRITITVPATGQTITARFGVRK